MGFFSWKTSDTQEAIRHIHSGDCCTVYLLQPNGKPIKEAMYEGYGEFGGVDAYTWLAKMNLSQESLARFDDDELRTAGISLAHGHLLRTHDGKLYSIFHGDTKIFEALGLNVEIFSGKWSDPIPELGASANDLVEKGQAMTVRFGELYQIRYPLKFSFSDDADYEALPAAEIDPDQGF